MQIIRQAWLGLIRLFRTKATMPRNALSVAPTALGFYFAATHTSGFAYARLNVRKALSN
jgi:hypothetical protein